MIITPQQPVTGFAERGAEAEALDLLRPEEVERMQYEVWTSRRAIALESADAKRSVVAEGDSWFDYSPAGLDHLKAMGYAIAKVARAGDSLENMVYGTEYERNFSRRQNPLDHTIRLMKANDVGILLFSGGGNDLAGAHLETLLNHKDMGGEPLRSQYVEYVLGTVVRTTYLHLIGRVRDEVGSDAHIITHGYGRPIPDGRAVLNLPWSWRFVGPWLRPALTKKNYVEAGEARGIVRSLLDRFNQTLSELASEPETRDNFHYLDLRQIILDEWWANELHLKNSAYHKVAVQFDRAIEQVAT